VLNIETRKEKNVGYLKLIGELDISTVELFRIGLENVRNGADQVLLDFNELQFVDSTGVGGLVQAIKKLHEDKISVQVQNISQEVFEVLDLLGIPELLGEDIFVKRILT